MMPIKNNCRQKKLSLECLEKDLAFSLYDVWVNSIYKAQGYSNFNLYVKEKLDMKPKKAKYLVHVVKRIKELNISESLVDEIGWYRFCVIASILTHANKDEWIEKAKVLSIVDLCEAVGQYKKQNKKQSKKRFTCQLSDEQYEIVETAIDEAKHRLGVNTIGDCIAQICYEWYQNLD